MKVDLRVAQVIHAEPVKKADKLLKLQFDLGYEKRQVVSGIAKYYKPEELVGRKVICVTNLKASNITRRIIPRNDFSREERWHLSLATVDQKLPNGSKVK